MDIREDRAQTCAVIPFKCGSASRLCFAMPYLCLYSRSITLWINSLLLLWVWVDNSADSDIHIRPSFNQEMNIIFGWIKFKRNAMLLIQYLAIVREKYAYSSKSNYLKQFDQHGGPNFVALLTANLGNFIMPISNNAGLSSVPRVHKTTFRILTIKCQFIDILLPHSHMSTGINDSSYWTTSWGQHFIHLGSLHHRSQWPALGQKSYKVNCFYEWAHKV